jgi:hypothetical protein
VAIAVVGASLWIGLSARGAAATLTARRLDWAEAARSIESARRELSAASAGEIEVARKAEGERRQLGVAAAESAALLDSLGRLARAAGLTDVGVSRVLGDGSPRRSDATLAAAGLRRAGYAVVVDFTGGFADVVKFVSTVPSSVSLSQFTGARQPGRARYQVLFSVHELDAIPGH